MIFFIFLSILVPVANLEKETCEPKCHFTEPTMTPETIKKWPSSCKKVCGNLYIGSESNKTEKELKSTFHILEALIGNVKIEKTSFKSLNFLNSIRRVVSKPNGVTIRSNVDLKNVEAIWLWDVWSPYDPVIWNVHDNPKLNFEPFCDRAIEEMNMDYNIYGNLKDCGCRNVRISNLSLPYYSKCTSIRGGQGMGLKITEVNDSDDLSGLKLLKNLTMSLEIYGTTLQNISFLENLEKIEVTQSQGLFLIRIVNNPKMTRLGLESLKTILPYRDYFVIELKNNHKDLCISTRELQVFAENRVILNYDFLKVCDDLYRKDGEKVCNFGDLSTMESSCQHVIGDVIIDGSNEKYSWKLGNMTNIYGSLTVQYTQELTDLSFLANLRQVAVLEFDKDKPLIGIYNNKNLQNVVFLSMKSSPYPDDTARIEEQIIDINGNTLEIFKYQEQCLELQKSTQTKIKYNKKSCDKLPTQESSTPKPTTIYEKYGVGTVDLFEKRIDNHDYLFDKNLMDTFNSVVSTLQKIYDIAAFVNFFVNLPRLFILTRKKLRNNLIYIIMMGICIADLIHSIGRISSIFMTLQILYQPEGCFTALPYYHVLTDILAKCMQIMSRRCSGFLALFIAAFRAFSVLFPMSDFGNFFMESRSGYLIVLFFMVVCGVWSSMYWVTTIVERLLWCPDGGSNPSWVMYKHDTFGKAEERVRVIDGYMALVVCALYLLATAALLIALARAKQRRKNLKNNDKASNTSLMVIIMAVFMLISEATYGWLFILSSVIFVDFEERKPFEQLEVFAMTLSIINSIAHCFICFFLSSQYKEVVKRVIWTRKEREEDSFRTATIKSSGRPLSKQLVTMSNVSK